MADQLGGGVPAGPAPGAVTNVPRGIFDDLMDLITTCRVDSDNVQLRLATSVDRLVGPSGAVAAPGDVADPCSDAILYRVREELLMLRSTIGEIRDQVERLEAL
ncbi:MAG: hypothetical protein AAF479_14370 [Pseudomonadota bacterium]